MAEIKDINRIKVILVEKKRSNKWLAEQLGKDPATVSKWCTNTSQPTIETLLKIAEVLEVNYTELVRSQSVLKDKNYEKIFFDFYIYNLFAVLFSGRY